MTALFRKVFSTLLFPTGWTILTIISLCLPGSAIPDKEFFGLEEFDHVDKAVHVLLFAGLVLCWGWYSMYRHKQYGWKVIVLFVFLSIALGVILEYVQLYFIPFRSFDEYDIIADSAGAIAAGLLLVLTRRR